MPILGKTPRFAAQQDLGLQGHGVGNLFNVGESSLGHHVAEFVRGAQAPAAHGQKIEMEVSIPLWWRIGVLCHGLGQQQGPPGGQCIVDVSQQLGNVRIGMVVRHSNQSDKVRTGGQPVMQETAPMRRCASAKPLARKVAKRQRRHLRQVEQHEFEMRRVVCQARHECALPAAHVQYPSVPAEVIDLQDFVHYKWL